MTIVARFRVATRASGTRRQVYVHVYDDVQQMGRAHCADRGIPFNPADDIAGGVSVRGVGGMIYHRKPEAPPAVIVMRLWTEQLTGRTIAHEATHCATAIYFMDGLRGWDTRARAILMGDHEPLAYLVGDIAAEVTMQLYAHRLLP